MQSNEITDQPASRLKARAQKTQPVVEPLEQRSYLSLTFSGPTFYTGVRGVTAMATGNLLGDGQSDIVVAGLSPSAPSVAVLGVYPDQAGSFGTPTVYPLGSTAGGVAIGDFRGQGQQDLVATDPSDNELIAFLNDGHGNFTPGAGAQLPGSGGDMVIVAADFNGDGKDDVAVADPNDNRVVIAFSNGDGSFTTQAPISVPDPLKIVAVDLNGDSHPDLAILSGQSPTSLYIALNNGNGTFATPVAYSFGADGGSIVDLSAADFNGDHAPDLVGVGSNAGAGVAAVLLNQGNGTFAAATDVALPGNVDAVVTGDFTGSGQADIAAIGAGGSLDILPGNGDGTFGADQTVVTNQLATPGNQAVTADFDENGAADIGYLSRSQGGFGILLNSGPAPTSSAVVPSLSGKLTTKTLVAGGRITPIAQTLTFTATSAFSGTVTVNLQFSLTNSFNSANPTVATITRKLNLKAGRNLKVPVAVRSLPAGLSGTYYLVGQLTDSSDLTATAASSQTVGIVPPTIDLSGGFAFFPSSAKAGKKTHVTLGITNYGSVVARGSLPVEIFSSTSGALDSTAVLLDQIARPVAIQPGKSTKLVVVIPTPTTAGSYYLIAVLDPQNTFNDVSLTNNIFVSGEAVAIS